MGKNKKSEQRPTTESGSFGQALEHHVVCDDCSHYLQFRERVKFKIVPSPSLHRISVRYLCKCQEIQIDNFESMENAWSLRIGDNE